MLLAASCQPSTTAEVSLRNHSLGDESMFKFSWLQWKLDNIYVSESIDHRIAPAPSPVSLLVAEYCVAASGQTAAAAEARQKKCTF